MKRESCFLGINEDQIGKYIFIPGSVERAKLIAMQLTNPKTVSNCREFSIYNAELMDEKVSVVSTGIGECSASITLEELISLGSHTFLRIGSCASASVKSGIGDVIISKGAVRMEGVSSLYLPSVSASIPDFHFFRTLVNEAKKTNYPFNTGVTITKDSFYTEVNPEQKPVCDTLEKQWKSYLKAGATSTSMEEAAIFAIGSKKKVRTASVAICATNFEEYSNLAEDYPSNWENRAIEVGIKAMARLIKEDCNEY